MIHVDLDDISKVYFDGLVVLYGAGHTGKIIANLLLEKSVMIDLIVDDDPMQQGKEMFGVKIISFSQMEDIIQKYDRVNCILSLIYGKSIIRKLQRYSNIYVYEMYELCCNFEWGGYYRETITEECLKAFGEASESFKDKWADQLSRDTFEGLYHFLQSGDFNCIFDICSEEEQYFIALVRDYFMNVPMYIIDGGASKGELYRAIASLGLKLGKWYCFEADPENYSILVQNIDKLNLQNKCDPICKGLWDKEEKLYFVQNETGSKIVDYQTDCMIETVRIDDVFRNSMINFVKMDIEGAEYRALGGGMNVIQQNRPVLAISIYHSTEDFYKIPNMLMEKLQNYHYYVRQHALIFCETILYAVPNELEIIGIE